MLEAFRTAFENRSVAGRALGERLARMNLADPVVLALPRGGVPVGLEVARALDAPLDLLLVRKIGVPWQPELAVGAVMDGSAPTIVVDPRVQAETGIDRQYIEERAQQELKEIERRRALYLAQRAPEPVTGRTAIVVDDGIATGTTVRAALRGLRQRNPGRLVLAVPVAPPETIEALRAEVDDVVCLMQPEFFGAIGYFYIDFHQLTDDEVIALLRQAPHARQEPSAFA
ncbi:MAG TPA: phosphoribosyltransferase family protein [Burkholderiaceae bacterium]|nr:phosphoribosyltransferase family protein [Burkholderiaceae bacterium]